MIGPSRVAFHATEGAGRQVWDNVRNVVDVLTMPETRAATVGVAVSSDVLRRPCG